MIERNHLKIIQAVASDGSLTAAAQSLNLTQSALSHTIKKLEDQCGTAIWLREGRNLKLTPAGQYLLNIAQRVLPQLQHADQVISHFAQGEKGLLRIGMECHPCYQWLLKVVTPYLEHWNGVDIDVRQRFQFGGMAALFNYEIDLLVTPDPMVKPGVCFIPVFDYEQVLVISSQHMLASQPFVTPEQLVHETLLTYPVEADRLDIFTQFFTPSPYTPARVKTVEATEILIQLVAANRGVAALPKWLVESYQQKFSITSVRLNRSGIQKKIYLGYREGDQDLDYLTSFIDYAKSVS